MQLKQNRLTKCAAILAAAGLIASLAAQPKRAPGVTTTALVNAAGNGEEWLSYGHDYAETHFSPLTQITTKNVKRLKLAWSVVTDAPQGTGRGHSAHAQRSPLRHFPLGCHVRHRRAHRPDEMALGS